jgi:tetratricopeptide (TPR) repeat protein
MNRLLSSVFVGLLAATSARAALAADVCVGEESKKALNACPNTGPQQFNVGARGKQPQMSFRSAPTPKDLKKRDQQTKPGAPSEQMSAAQRDDRKNRLQARQRALLVTEIQQIEALFKTTPKNAPDRPQIARRLAETYVELESAAFRDKTTAEIERDNLKKSNPQGAGQKQTLANQANGIMLAARKNAVQYYSLLKDQYPNYPALDEVLYYLAYEYEQSSDYPNARKVYYELIQKKPNSKYIPNAYLAFGELFFNEAQGDPSKWDLSAEAYKKVIEYPAPDNKVYGYAWYKLAYVFWNKGEFDKALNAFKKTIDYGVTYAQLPNASKLAESARRDIIPVYALKGDPNAAYNFFRNISGDAAGQNDKTFKMMNDLGQNYLDTGHYPEAIALYKDLLVRDRQSERICEYQANITEAVMAMKSGNKDAVKGEIDNQVKLYSEFKAGGHSPQAKLTCANKTAALATETAMAWHLEAVGSQGQRGTGDQKTMTLSAALYKRVVDNFTQEDFSNFEFPRLVKDDWPNIYKIKYNMADLLYFQQKWAECGPAFDSVVAENPNAPEAAEAAYAAVLCYQNIYDQAHPKGSDRKGAGNLPGQDKKKDSKADESARLQPKDFTENQKGMISAFNRYICYIKPAANDAAGQEQLVEVKYARARTYFEAQHWEEASLAFRDIAINNADRDVGIYAAQLYLESINVLGTHSNPPRPSCYDDMSQDVPKFIELYCSGDKAAKNQEQCTILTKIQVDILRLKAQKLVEVADKGGSGSLQQYEQAGNAYLDMYRKYCEAPIRAGQPAQAERCDEIVYNAARAYQAGRLIAKAIAARMILLNPQNKMDNSPLAKKAIYEIGGNYQAIAVYDQAADWYEKYQKADPKAEKADQALSDAVLLRLGLGDQEKAIENARTFQKSYGASKPAQAAAIAFAVGAHHADKAENGDKDDKTEWEKARLALQGSMGVINKAPPDIQVQAHATLGRALARLRKEDEAAKEYAKVRGLWSDPSGAVKRINDAYPSEDQAQKDRRIGKALSAVGEAIFYNAEQQKKASVDNLRFPEYKGSGTKDDVLKHINTKVKDWLEKKVPAIDKVAAEYKKIVDLQPDAPPRWVIAAGSRVGLMWGDLVDDFRRAPIPEAWKKDAEIRGVYYDALDQRSEPIKVQRAKPALVTCLTYSVKFQYFDQYSRSCEEWLAKNYKSEYKVVDELRGAPTLSNSGLDDKPPPLLVGGMAYQERREAPPAEKPAAASSEPAPAAEPAAAPKRGAGRKK